jgi:hypothetical protein
MTTLLEKVPADQQDSIKMHNFAPDSAERRKHRRHEMDTHGIPVDRWDGGRRVGKPFGQIVDLSASGIRIRTQHKNLKADAQIRLRLELPDYAGISPFIDRTNRTPEGKREWVGWMAISRVVPINDNELDVAGRLVDMDEMDRGMLSLYLSTQPIAA